MNPIYFSISILSFFLVFFVLIYFVNKLFYFYNYKKIVDLFEYFLEKSYTLTYESNIISWISNGIQNIPAEEKETIERDFIKQTFLLMGINNKKIFTKFFGSDINIINYMILFIRTKISNDGLAAVLKNNDLELK